MFNYIGMEPSARLHLLIAPMRVSLKLFNETLPLIYKAGITGSFENEDLGRYIRDGFDISLFHGDLLDIFWTFAGPLLDI